MSPGSCPFVHLFGVPRQSQAVRRGPSNLPIVCLALHTSAPDLAVIPVAVSIGGPIPITFEIQNPGSIRKYIRPSTRRLPSHVPFS